jgi:hypothetical protein
MSEMRRTKEERKKERKKTDHNEKRNREREERKICITNSILVERQVKVLV